MLLQSLRALCFAPGGPGSIWNYLGALVRFTRVSGRFACGFRTDLHFADVSCQIFESRLNCFLTKCMFGPPKLVSENGLCGPNSIERSSEREYLESSSYEKTATKSAINCQSKASLQSSAIASKHNHFNFGAPQLHQTAFMQPSFLCPP